VWQDADARGGVKPLRKELISDELKTLRLNLEFPDYRGRPRRERALVFR
jgi:hypothetical protein